MRFIALSRPCVSVLNLGDSRQHIPMAQQAKKAVGLFHVFLDQLVVRKAYVKVDNAPSVFVFVFGLLFICIQRCSVCLKL